MMPRLLPPAARAANRRRWSFRLSSLTSITAVCAAAWEATPTAWHPELPEWGKYVVMGIAIALALGANASHMFAQPSLHDGGDAGEKH